jgi:hypothetical protein
MMPKRNKLNESYRTGESKRLESGENGASAMMRHLKDIRTISTAWFAHDADA